MPHQWHSGNAQNWKTGGAGFKLRSCLSTQPFGVFCSFLQNSRKYGLGSLGKKGFLTSTFLRNCEGIQKWSIFNSLMQAHPTSGITVTPITGRPEVPGSNPGLACRPSRSEFSVVFSETRVNTGQDTLKRPPRRASHPLAQVPRETIGHKPFKQTNKNHFPFSFLLKIHSYFTFIQKRILK